MFTKIYCSIEDGSLAEMKDSDTIKLIRIIGLPDNSTNMNRKDCSEGELLRLMQLAIKNKVPLLFLENAIEICDESDSLKRLHRVYQKNLESTLSLVKETSELLCRENIDCVLFKTLKPFPFTVSDLDILFFTYENLTKAHHLLLNHGFTLAGYGPNSISLYNFKHAMNVDLQLEIAVSRLIYIDKKLLRQFVTEIDVNDAKVNVLEPPASLATVLAHSLYKEQLFTLSDYYTTVMVLLKMTDKQRRTFVELAKRAHIESSVKTILVLINAITKVVFGRTNSTVNETLQMTESYEIEDKMINLFPSNFIQNTELPYKFHPLTLITAFSTKTFNDPVLRGTMPQQLVEIIKKPSEFMEAVMFHIKRATY
jgi:hypothetical protein